MSILQLYYTFNKKLTKQLFHRLIQDLGNHPFRRCGFRSLTEIICCPSKPYEVKSTTKKPTPIPTDKFGITIYI